MKVFDMDVCKQSAAYKKIFVKIRLFYQIGRASCFPYYTKERHLILVDLVLNKKGLYGGTLADFN